MFPVIYDSRTDALHIGPASPNNSLTRHSSSPRNRFATKSWDCVAEDCGETENSVDGWTLSKGHEKLQSLCAEKNGGESDLGSQPEASSTTLVAATTSKQITLETYLGIPASVIW